MRVLLLNDGKVGHFNQSKALAQNLNYEILNIKAKKSKSFLRFIFRFYIFKSIKLLNLFYKVDKKISKVDLIISSGKDTEYLNIWLKNIFNCKNIYLGKPRGVDSKYFDYIFTTLDLKLPNQILLDAIPSIHKKSIENLNLDKNQTYYTLLFGGNSSNYKYDKSDILNLAKLLNQISKRENIKWLITTSPRSQNEKLLQDSTESIEYFVNYNQNPQNTIASFFENSEKIFVTEDSSSMISDSINSKKPTFSLYPKNHSLSSDSKTIIENLIAKKLLKRVSIDESNFDFLNDNFNQLKEFDLELFFQNLK